MVVGEEGRNGDGNLNWGRGSGSSFFADWPPGPPTCSCVPLGEPSALTATRNPSCWRFRQAGTLDFLKPLAMLCKVFSMRISSFLSVSCPFHVNTFSNENLKTPLSGLGGFELGF